MTEPILVSKKIDKSFPIGKAKEIKVLDSIDLKVQDGDFISILGASGAGKSTLLRILAGLSEPTGGEVLYHGIPLEKANPKIAMVFQSFALFPWLTVLENVELGLKSYDIPAMKARDRSVKMLDVVGLDGFEDAYPRELSGGMRQRVGLARALVVEPEVLFMDEPFSALDVLTAEHLRSDLVDLWVERKMPTKSIIMVTHNIEEAVSMSNRAVILSHNPARVKADFRMDMPYPRHKDSKECRFVIDRIYTILSKPAEEVPFLVELGKYQFLPHIKMGAIAGLIELVEGREGKIDIPVLASELSMEVDDIFPLIEAAVFLGLGEIKTGDFLVTDTGSEFAKADTLRKKDIFRTLATENIQLISQIVKTLHSVSKHRISEEFFIEILKNHFTEDEAWTQLEIAIDWGRYAELFAYDYDTGELYLEKED